MNSIKQQSLLEIAQLDGVGSPNANSPLVQCTVGCYDSLGWQRGLKMQTCQAGKNVCLHIPWNLFRSFRFARGRHWHTNHKHKEMVWYKMFNTLWNNSVSLTWILECLLWKGAMQSLSWLLLALQNAHPFWRLRAASWCYPLSIRENSCTKRPPLNFAFRRCLFLCVMQTCADETDRTSSASGLALSTLYRSMSLQSAVRVPISHDLCTSTKDDPKIL